MIPITAFVKEGCKKTWYLYFLDFLPAFLLWFLLLHIKLHIFVNIFNMLVATSSIFLSILKSLDPITMSSCIFHGSLTKFHFHIFFLLYFLVLYLPYNFWYASVFLYWSSTPQSQFFDIAKYVVDGMLIEHYGSVGTMGVGSIDAIADAKKLFCSNLSNYFSIR